MIKVLPAMKVVGFSAFAPEPEQKAKKKLDNWLVKTGLKNRTHRIFGHNIDRDGNLDHSPQNVGYKFLVTIPNDFDLSEESLKSEMIKSGKFIIVSTEGNFLSDPEGKFIGDGWQKIHQEIAQKKLKVKPNCRWFEEEVKPLTEGNLRLDLYLEVE